ncbi:MAG: hypothetical protein H6739_30725 [Alphaproteobacteria bacterium]|nr:hypothetical protein [Alphaproteobacteria bacterium]
MTILPVLLLACGSAPEPESAPPHDSSALEALLTLSVPESASSLLNGLLDDVRQGDCEPAVFDEVEALRESWSACAAHDGAIERYEDDALSWMEIEGLVLRDDRGDPRLWAEGAIERFVDEDSARWTRLDLAAALGGVEACGDALCDPDAEPFADPLLVDLSWTLVHDGDAQDVLVTGTVLSPTQGAWTVEGSWRQDPAVCDGAPSSGLLLLRDQQLHTLGFSDACDRCVRWSVDGEPQGLLCPEIVD